MATQMPDFNHSETLLLTLNARKNAKLCPLKSFAPMAGGVTVQILAFFNTRENLKKNCFVFLTATKNSLGMHRAQHYKYLSVSEGRMEAWGGQRRVNELKQHEKFIKERNIRMEPSTVQERIAADSLHLLLME